MLTTLFSNKKAEPAVDYMEQIAGELSDMNANLEQISNTIIELLDYLKEKG